MLLAYLLYDFLLILFFLLYAPLLIYKLITTTKYRTDFMQRFGFLSANIKKKFKGEDTIWIHAASVGEVGAASPVVSRLRERFPEYKIIFSTMTDTGRDMAKKIIKEADEFIYIPFDFSWALRRVLKIIKPELVLIMETELWPNFIRCSKAENAKVMVVSGRISNSSFKQYKYLGFLLKDMLAKIDLFSMQSAKDMKRIIELGADQQKVCNNGNTKFDQEYGQIDQVTRDRIYSEFKINPKQAIIVAGSTHDDEEEQILSLYKKLKIEFPDLLLLLAPRYIKRVEEIAYLYEQEGVKVVKRSQIIARSPEQESVILVDTIGELAKLYSIADLVFVGGSLIERGGHNILEPAAQGKLVFFGSHMFNFEDSTKLLLDYGVGVQVEDINELIEKMRYYLLNQNDLENKNRQALEMIKSNQGASARNIELVLRLLEDRKEIGL